MYNVVITIFDSISDSHIPRRCGGAIDRNRQLVFGTAEGGNIDYKGVPSSASFTGT